MVETGASGVRKTDFSAVAEDIIPDVDDTRDLGSSAKKWAAIWVVLAMVTSLTIGGAIKLTAIDGVLFVNASTQINGSLNVTENFTVDSPTFHVDSGSNMVGIGTVLPGAELHISASSPNLFIDALAGTTSNLRFRDGTVQSWRISRFDGPDDLRIVADVNDTNVMTFRTSGKVGIGTIDPTHELNVEGSGNFTQNVTASFFEGDGSKLTGISGGIWTNVSGTATYEENVNITGDLFVGNATNGQIKIHVGSIALPSYSFLIDPDTGLYRPSTNSLGITSGNIKTAVFTTNGIRIVRTGSTSSVAVAVGDDSNTGIYHAATDELGIVAGSVSFINLDEGTTDVAIFNTNGADVDFRIESDTLTHALFMDGATGFFGINTSTPSFPLEVHGNGSDTVTIWASGNVSATGFITRTSVYNPARGSVWNWIRDKSYYFVNGIVDHSKFYGAVTYKKKDTSRPVQVPVTEEECEISMTDPETGEGVEVCFNKTVMITEYPFQIEESGVELGEEINVLRQAMFELKQDNIAMKSELCFWNPNYSWC